MCDTVISSKIQQVLYLKEVWKFFVRFDDEMISRTNNQGGLTA